MSRLAIPKSNPNSPIELTSTGEELELRHLAANGVNYLLDQIEMNCKLEHVALLLVSSLCELGCPFTRDMDQVRAKLLATSCEDKTSLEVGLQGFVSLIQEEWGSNVPVTLIIVTDGGLGYGPYSLKSFVEVGPTELKLPILFPLSISVVCLAEANSGFYDSNSSKHCYEALFTKLGLGTNQGSYHGVEGTISVKSTEILFKEVADLHYKQWLGKLEMGKDMTSKIQLCPPPKPFRRTKEFEVVNRDLNTTLSVKGFVSLTDVSSPPVYSRHLILPVSQGKENKEEDAKTPNMCVFIHGALKVENMCGIVQVGEEWYGILYSWSDSKKKSSLMLSIFEPGLWAVPWLGSLNRLGPASDLNQTLQSPFPVKSDRKPSYSSSPVVWIKQSGIQSDIQKVLRHARKLPDKTAQFYKELNRLKRAAVCLGFYELLEGVAQICERECGLLPANVSPDCAIQLTYVAQVLRSAECYSVTHTIMPRITNFNAAKL